MVVLVRLVLSSIVDGGSLLDARIVALPFDFGIWREGEKTLHSLSAIILSDVLTLSKGIGAIPNPKDPSTIHAGPDTQNVLSIANAEDRTADLVTGFCELVAHNGIYQILPVSVRYSLL